MLPVRPVGAKARKESMVYSVDHVPRISRHLRRLEMFSTTNNDTDTIDVAELTDVTRLTDYCRPDPIRVTKLPRVVEICHPLEDAPPRHYEYSS